MTAQVTVQYDPRLFDSYSVNAEKKINRIKTIRNKTIMRDHKECGRIFESIRVTPTILNTFKRVEVA
jgi:hypothetical protein